MSADSAMEYAQGLADTLRSENEDTIPDVGEYLEGILDYQYTRNAQGDLVSVRLLVAFGGPNAWVTYDGSGALVEASWYSEWQRVYVDDVPLSAMIVEYFDEAVLV
jgi:hypothetical protein